MFLLKCKWSACNLGAINGRGSRRMWQPQSYKLFFRPCNCGINCDGVRNVSSEAFSHHFTTHQIYALFLHVRLLQGILKKTLIFLNRCIRARESYNDIRSGIFPACFVHTVLQLITWLSRGKTTPRHMGRIYPVQIL